MNWPTDTCHFKICHALRYDAKLSASKHSELYVLLRESHAITAEMVTAAFQIK